MRHDEQTTAAETPAHTRAGHEHHDGHELHATHAEPAGHEHAGGHDKHAGHSAGMFRDRFWISLLLTAPILLWSEMVQEWLGYTAPTFPLSGRIPALLGTVVFVYGGMPFLRGGAREIRDRKPGMMLLISLAIVVAFLSSLASELSWFSVEFWWELALLIDVMLLGHWQEMKALGQASSALDALAALLPEEAEVVHGSEIHSVAIGSLQPGDLVLVRPGGRVPADGTIAQGAASFDESMITGESRPVARGVGERVVAGTVATDMAVRVRVTAVGSSTTLAGIQRMIADAQASRSRAQDLADRAAAILFWVAVGAGAVTFVVWSLIGSASEAAERTVTVLVISCPHALGLAIPLVIAISTGVAARDGILVKDRLALERMRTVGAVLFDKTGTLTKGEPTVRAVVGDGVTDAQLLRLAGAVEADSEHPLARAILAKARAVGDVPTAQGFRSLTGRGAEAVVDGSTIRVGGPALLAEIGISAPGSLQPEAERWRARGASVLAVVRDDTMIGLLALEDDVRPESTGAIAALRAEGVRSIMITGDAEDVAATVAAEVGVDEYVAQVLPQDKADIVARYERQGIRVAMVGDGVNDAPALARADVGIAIGAGTDVAAETAGVILASDDPRGVVAVRRLSQASYRKMLQNLTWAVGYNVVAIPLAAGAFVWAGISFPPAVGAIAMSVSTIVVALNAQLLRRVDLRPTAVG